MDQGREAKEKCSYSKIVAGCGDGSIKVDTKLVYVCAFSSSCCSSVALVIFEWTGQELFGLREGEGLLSFSTYILHLDLAAYSKN